MQGRVRGLVVVWCAAALLGAGAVACSSDGTSSGSGGGTGRSGTSRRDQSATADERYCQAKLAVEVAPQPDVDPDAAAPDRTAALRASAVALQPDMARLEQTAPEEIEDEVAILIAAVDELASSGDPAAYEGNDEVQAAREEVHAYDLEHCDWHQQRVTAEDYAFAGVDESLEAGPVSIELQNEGEEYHELAVIKKKDGTTESFAEILALEDEEAQQAKAEFAGGIAAIAPGGEGWVVLDLAPGEYLVACFLSVGSTPEKFESDEGAEGAPHFTRGMQRGLTVTPA